MSSSTGAGEPRPTKANTGAGAGAGEQASTKTTEQPPAATKATTQQDGKLTSTETDKQQPGEPTSKADLHKGYYAKPAPPAAGKAEPRHRDVSAPPYKLHKSTAYERLRAQHPAEFEPASVFFTQQPGTDLDRRNSLRVKAALVYEAVTGSHGGDSDQMLRLLLALAKKCHAKMHAQTVVHGAGETGDAAADEAGFDKDMMRVLDGIFLVVGFLPKLNEAITSKNADRDSVDQSFRSRHMLEIVMDVIKLENQVPRLQDLLDVARHIKDVIGETAGNFEGVKKSVEVVTEENLGDVIHRFCWYYSPFATTKKPAANSPFKDVATKKEMAARTLLDCLHMTVVKPPPAEGKDKGGASGGRPSRMPTARDLRRSGVRLQASESGRAEIEFTQWTLWMPALVYDFKLATVARNLLAREYEEEQSKPVTRYFQMMNEMVEDAADVRILRRAGVVRGGSRGGQEVCELIKNIDGHATYPSVYMAMDREIDKVREYHDQRMANFFVRNRPGVIWASSVAAISLAAIVATRRRRG